MTMYRVTGRDLNGKETHFKSGITSYEAAEEWIDQNDHKYENTWFWIEIDSDNLDLMMEQICKHQI